MNVRPYDNKGALNHMGFQVADTAAVVAMKERFQEAGLVSIDEMGTTCCYAEYVKKKSTISLVGF